MTDSTSTPDGSLAAHVTGMNWDDTEPDKETAAQVSTTPARAAVAPKPKGFYVPKWVAAATVVVVIGGAGFAVGQVTATDNTGSAAASARSPFSNGRFGPFSPRQGTRTAPGGLGSGSTSGGTTPGSNSTGNGSGTQTTPSTTTGQAFLGVSVQDAANAQGATIGTVASGSPAATAGLQSGDVVTAVDTTAVTTASGLGTAIHAHQPGDSVTITYQRNGTTSTVHVTLGSPAAASTTPSN